MAKKKKGGRKPREGGKRKGVTIQLVTGVGASPSQATARRNDPAGPPDRVRWWNRTDRGHTLEFTQWPFAESPQSIAVEAGKKSKWFTIYSGTLDGAYDYTIVPTINPPSGPPDEPAIVVQS